MKRKEDSIVLGRVFGFLVLMFLMVGVGFAADGDDGIPPDVEGDVKLAVIVVGSEPGDAMNVPFANTGDRLYNTLKARGFTDDSILYLGWDPGNAAIDGWATGANIQWGLETWLRGRLNNGTPDETVVIYFIDHGTTSAGYYVFVPYDYNGGAAPVFGFDLSQWVTVALQDWNGNKNYDSATIVTETCYSGMLVVPPPLGFTGPDRIVISATDSILESYFWWMPPQAWYDNRPPDSNGEGIFSYYFMQNINVGIDVKNSFKNAYHQTVNEVFRLQSITNNSGEQQFPQMNDQYGRPLFW